MKFVLITRNENSRILNLPDWLYATSLSITTYFFSSIYTLEIFCGVQYAYVFIAPGSTESATCAALALLIQPVNLLMFAAMFTLGILVLIIALFSLAGLQVFFSSPKTKFKKILLPAIVSALIVPIISLVFI